MDIRKEIADTFRALKVTDRATPVLIDKLTSVAEAYALEESQSAIAELFEEVKQAMDNVWSVHEKFREALGLEEDEDEL